MAYSTEGSAGIQILKKYQNLVTIVSNNVDNVDNDDNVDNFALCVREQEDAGGWSTLISNNHLFNKNKN